MENVVIVSGLRTPIGAYGGSLRNLHVSQFCALVLIEAVKRIGIDPAAVEDVIMGQSYQNGECANGARLALLEANWPDSVPGITLDRRCCSGLDAVFFRRDEDPDRQRRHRGGRRHGKHEPGRTLCSGRYPMGSWWKNGPKMGIYAQRAWSPIHVGHPVFRPHPARPGDVAAH